MILILVLKNFYIEAKVHFLVLKFITFFIYVKSEFTDSILFANEIHTIKIELLLFFSITQRSKIIDIRSGCSKTGLQVNASTVYVVSVSHITLHF